MRTADAITWRSDTPVWIEQWPLTGEKIQAATELVMEQLKAGHIEPTTSPWNTPIFVIKKKSGQWRLLQDLRAINNTMQDMGPLQPGLPSPSAIPKNNHIVVIDLQDCFFTIPLDEKDCQRFAFSLPSVNLKEPYKRYHWKVLPQGMKNSPTLCQKFVGQALEQVRQQYPQTYIIHYMDDILLADPDSEKLKQVLEFTVISLENYGLKVAPEKIQLNPPFNYLGRLLHEGHISHQPIQLRTDNLTTLNDFQKLLGDINWIRPFLKLTTAELKPLFDILRGDSDPSSSRTLTAEAQTALQKVNKALNDQKLYRLDYNQPWQFYILPTPYTPTGVLWQNGPLEWIHLPVTARKILAPYAALMAQLTLKGRHRSKELFGQEFQELSVPLTAEQIQNLMTDSLDWQIALASYSGQIVHHLPSHPLLRFVAQHQFLIPKLFSKKPIPGAITVFTDGSSNGTAAIVLPDQCYKTQTAETSAQRTEIIAVIKVFEMLADQSFNLYTDSQYIVRLFPHLETANIPENKTSISCFLLTLQNKIHRRQVPFFVGYIRAHTALPGPLAEGNNKADLLTRVNYIFPVSEIEKAKESHKLHHQNATALRYEFKIPREAARAIVRECTHCPQYFPVPQMGVNPRGLRPLDLWQMDVTHIPTFGRLSYVHVTIDTCSHALFATARTGEAAKDVIQHLVAAFAVLGRPKAIKTDNAPAYTSQAFQTFALTFGIQLKTGIPYNPQGQGMVERAHQILKQQISKLQQGDMKYSSPHHILNHALFVINVLNVDAQGKSSYENHWAADQHSVPKPLVKWKDPMTGQWHGPDVLLTCGRGYACVFPQNSSVPVWIPDRFIRHNVGSTTLPAPP